MTTSPVLAASLHSSFAQAAASKKAGGASFPGAASASAPKTDADFADLVLLHSLTQGASLVGKNVIYSQQGTAHAAKGKVSSVAVENGKVFLLVGQNKVALSQVRAITS
jgi:hypothetical protein